MFEFGPRCMLTMPRRLWICGCGLPHREGTVPLFSALLPWSPLALFDALAAVGDVATFRVESLVTWWVASMAPQKQVIAVVQVASLHTWIWLFFFCFYGIGYQQTLFFPRWGKWLSRSGRCVGGFKSNFRLADATFLACFQNLLLRPRAALIFAVITAGRWLRLALSSGPRPRRGETCSGI